MKKPVVVCPVTKVALLLSDTWTMLILHFLIEGPKGFCELERALHGISTRTLTLKLGKLITEGLLMQTKKGLYKATRRGRGIRIIENAMKRYQKRYL